MAVELPLVSHLVLAALQQFALDFLLQHFMTVPLIFLVLLHEVLHKLLYKTLPQSFETGCKKKAEKQPWCRGKRRRMEG